MSRLSTAAPITVLTYAAGSHINALLRDICGHLIAQGATLAGMVQINTMRPGRSHCDMLLEDLGSGERVEISEYRGPEARGCMLDVPQLMVALERAARALANPCDLLVVNKFGKTEVDGGGFRPLISEALSRNIPVLIAVPAASLPSWRQYAGDLAKEFAIEELPGGCGIAAACRYVGLDLAPTASPASSAL
ncbi:MAG: DUF2478 domain-containing protein [Hyphomicrobiaceae bacterium]